MLLSIDPAIAPPPLDLVAGFANVSGQDHLQLHFFGNKAGESWNGVAADPVAALGGVCTVALDGGTGAYLCGPPGMVAAASNVLLKRRLPAAAIFNEVFARS